MGFGIQEHGFSHIKNIASDIPLKEAIWGVVPFLLLMFLAVFLICLVSGIAARLPDLIMGRVSESKKKGGHGHPFKLQYYRNLEFIIRTD